MWSLVRETALHMLVRAQVSALTGQRSTIGRYPARILFSDLHAMSCSGQGTHT